MMAKIIMTSIRTISYQQSHFMAEIPVHQGWSRLFDLVIHRGTTINVHNLKDRDDLSYPQAKESLEGKKIERNREDENQFSSKKK